MSISKKLKLIVRHLVVIFDIAKHLCEKIAIAGGGLNAKLSEIEIYLHQFAKVSSKVIKPTINLSTNTTHIIQTIFYDLIIFLGVGFLF